MMDAKNVSPSKTSKTAVPSRRLIYLVEGNTAFTRLLSVVINQLQGFSHFQIPQQSLFENISQQRPDLIIILEDIEQYKTIRQDGQMRDIPILFVTVSELDAKFLSELIPPDTSWVLRNDPADLLKTIQAATPTPRVKHILCVDDSTTVLKQILKTFTGTPYSIHTAGNGREGMEKLLDFVPDLILTDVEMPEMDGLTFCRKIRERPQTSNIPLIILSSRIDYETIAKGFESGADEYLTKPFYPDELLNKVESYLLPPPTRRKEKILICSSNSTINHQLSTALEKQGFEVKTVGDTDSALSESQGDPPTLVIADSALPDMGGFKLCAQVRSIPALDRVPYVLLTSKTTSGARKMGKRFGVTAYLPKPFTREGMLVLVERLLAEHRSLQALEWDMVLASITSLAKALDERDPYTRFHSENVARYAVAIARKDGFNSVQLENIRLAGLLHDIGKIGIPDKVLHKPEKLTSEEFEQIKQHSRLGAEILKPISSLEEMIPGILHHHERVDGNGYPDRLMADEIPATAQILAVADTFDALVTDRPYRQGRSKEEALSIIRKVAGTQLSEHYVRIFIDWLSQNE